MLRKPWKKIAEHIYGWLLIAVRGTLRRNTELKLWSRIVALANSENASALGLDGQL